MSPAVLFSARIGSPEEIEAAVEPMVGRSQVRAKPGSPFRASLRLATVENFGFMEISLPAFAVSLSEEHSVYAVNLALDGEFRSLRGRSRRSFTGRDALVTCPGEPFELEAARDNAILAWTMHREHLDEYARRTRQESGPLRLPGTLRLEGDRGSALMRYLAFVRGELARGGGLLASPLARSEIADTLMALFLWVCETAGSSPSGSAGSAERAAEYLRSNLARPISRAELAEHVGTPLRSLARAFRLRYGMGPIAFLKQCRLESARERLLAAEPESTTVTEVALACGLEHLGRFAADYHRAFGELPSESLRWRSARTREPDSPSPSQQ